MCLSTSCVRLSFDSVRNWGGGNCLALIAYAALEVREMNQSFNMLGEKCPSMPGVSTLKVSFHLGMNVVNISKRRM